MNPLEQLKAVSQGVTEFHGQFVQSIADTQDVGLRHYMTALAGRIKELLAQVEQSFPKAYTTIQQEVAVTQKQNEAILQQVAALKKQQAEAQLAAAPMVERPKSPVPPQPPELPTLTPKLSQTLRQELLEKFGMKGPHKHKLIEYQEPAEDWQDPKPKIGPQIRKDQAGDSWLSKNLDPSIREMLKKEGLF